MTTHASAIAFELSLVDHRSAATRRLLCKTHAATPRTAPGMERYIKLLRTGGAHTQFFDVGLLGIDREHRADAAAEFALDAIDALVGVDDLKIELLLHGGELRGEEALVFNKGVEHVA